MVESRFRFPHLSLLSRSVVLAFALALVSGRAHAQSPAADPVSSSLFEVDPALLGVDQADLREAKAGPFKYPSEHPDRAFNFVLGTFFTAASSDLAVSMYQIGRGVARERGFGAWWQDSPVLFATSKSAMAAGFAYGLQRVHKTRPKTALVMGVVASAVEGWLVVRNARIASHPR